MKKHIINEDRFKFYPSLAIVTMFESYSIRYTRLNYAKIGNNLYLCLLEKGQQDENYRR